MHYFYNNFISRTLDEYFLIYCNNISFIDKFKVFIEKLIFST